MNIVIDIRCLLEKNYSGVPNYTYNLLKNLFKVDSKNQYFLFYNKYSECSEIIRQIPQLNDLFSFPNIKFVDFHFPNKFLNFSLRFLRYPKLNKLIEKKVGNKVDVWFSPNPASVSLSKSCKFILTVHDLSFERYPEFFASRGNAGIDYIRGRFWHRYVGVKKLCRRADKIIAVSESTKNDLIDVYGVSEDKIKIVYEGSGVKEVEGEREEVRYKYNLPEKFILFLGTLEPRKNIESVIKAFRQFIIYYSLFDIHLIIAGKKGWLYQNLFKLASGDKNIHFIGYVDEKDKQILYQLASLFVFPSFYEGFGLPPLEAMSNGCPVIAGNTPSLSEIVSYAGILVDPYNTNDLVEAIKLVLSDEKLRKRLIKKGFERSKIFSWNNATFETINIFNE